jgi:putative ABC transport system ATP-binding protein
MVSKNLIEIIDLHKNYQTGEVVTPVLKGINLEIQEGEFLAIMGHSGAGKSTLMNILGFLDQPTEGQYKFEDINTEQLNDDQLAEIRNQKLGFVFQMFNLLARVSAMGNVKLPLLYSGVPEKDQNERAQKALAQVGLSHRLHNHPNQLSGGEQQRVAIARALINKPKLILADEPTGNLDSKSSYEIMDIFCQLHRKERHTIIMITHEPDIAEFAERLIMLDDGIVVRDEKKKACGLQHAGLMNNQKESTSANQRSKVNQF